MKAQINCTAPSHALTLSTLKLFRNKVTYEVMFVSECNLACTEGLLHTHISTHFSYFIHGNTNIIFVYIMKCEYESPD